MRPRDGVIKPLLLAPSDVSDPGPCLPVLNTVSILRFRGIILLNPRCPCGDQAWCASNKECAAAAAGQEPITVAGRDRDIFGVPSLLGGRDYYSNLGVQSTQYS